MKNHSVSDSTVMKCFKYNGLLTVVGGEKVDRLKGTVCVIRFSACLVSDPCILLSDKSASYSLCYFSTCKLSSHQHQYFGFQPSVRHRRLCKQPLAVQTFIDSHLTPFLSPFFFFFFLLFFQFEERWCCKLNILYSHIYARTILPYAHSFLSLFPPKLLETIHYVLFPALLEVYITSALQ